MLVDLAKLSVCWVLNDVVTQFRRASELFIHFEDEFLSVNLALTVVLVDLEQSLIVSRLSCCVL